MSIPEQFLLPWEKGENPLEIHYLKEYNSAF